MADLTLRSSNLTQEEFNERVLKYLAKVASDAGTDRTRDNVVRLAAEAEKAIPPLVQQGAAQRVKEASK